MSNIKSIETKLNWKFTDLNQFPQEGQKVIVLLNRIKGFDIVTCTYESTYFFPISVEDNAYEYYTHDLISAWCSFPEIEEYENGTLDKKGEMIV